MPLWISLPSCLLAIVQLDRQDLVTSFRGPHRGTAQYAENVANLALKWGPVRHPREQHCAGVVGGAAD
jgi:hypothetical protein